VPDKPKKGKTVAIWSALIGALVVASTLILLHDKISGLLGSGAGRIPVLPRSGPFAGEKVRIASGEVEVVEFVRFLSDYTGLPVIHDSSDKRILEGKILVTAPMEDVDGEVVRALLEANGFDLRVDKLPNGKEVLKLEVSPDKR
jgi:hypothetical protein